MKKEVALWIRVSTEEQAEGDSPEHHEKRGRLYAEMKGWFVKEVYNISGMTGKSVMDYPETKRMLEDVKRGHISGLIFSKLARFARNTKELLEFADIFKKHDADLISLQESIDTSTPAGKLFYTFQAALAEWEREEIVSRVRASVPIRAQLGKSLGGEAPFGYEYRDGKLAIKEDEAVVRRLVFELFIKHKRKIKVLNSLNEQGYRTRDGGLFTPTTIHRYLTDPITKGMRRMNYYKSLPYRGETSYKPEDEWIFTTVPAIVSEAVWDEANRILEAQGRKNKRLSRPAVHLFSGIAACECGGKMYMRSNSPRYVCYAKGCKNQIQPDDLEQIYKDELKSFLFDDTEIQKHIEREKEYLAEHRELLKGHEERIKVLRERIKQLLDLYYEGKVEKDAFPTYHTPLFTELKQRENALLETQGTIDTLSIQNLSNEQVLQSVRDLQERWDDLLPEEKRSIIETITVHLIVGKEDIDIKLYAIPGLVRTEEEPAGTEGGEQGAIVTTITHANILPAPSLELVQKGTSPFRRRVGMR